MGMLVMALINAPTFWQSSLSEKSCCSTKHNTKEGRINPSLKHKLTALNDGSTFSSVAVIQLLHTLDRIKIANHISCAKAVPRLHLLSVQFLDHAHVAALVAPGFRDFRRIERHPCYPGTGLAVHLDLIGANHALGNGCRFALVEITLVWSEVLVEFGGGNFADVAQVDVGERVALLVTDVARHVDAIEEIIDVVDARDALAAQEIAHAGLEDECLLPLRPGLQTGCGLREAKAQPHGHEAVSFNDFRIQPPGLRANLRAFHVMLGQMPVNLGIAQVTVFAPARRHQEVHDVQPEARLARAGLFIQETPLRNAAYIARLVNARLQQIRIDLDGCRRL